MEESCPAYAEARATLHDHHDHRLLEVGLLEKLTSVRYDYVPLIMKVLTAAAQARPDCFIGVAARLTAESHAVVPTILHLHLYEAFRQAYEESKPPYRDDWGVMIFERLLGSTQRKSCTEAMVYSAAVAQRCDGQGASTAFARVIELMRQLDHYEPPPYRRPAPCGD